MPPGGCQWQCCRREVLQDLPGVLVKHAELALQWGTVVVPLSIDVP